MRKYDWLTIFVMSIHLQTGLSEIQNFWLFVNLVSMVWYSFIQGLIRDH